MKLKPLDRAELDADPRFPLIRNYLNSLEELNHPQDLMRFLCDYAHLEFYIRSIRQALRARPGSKLLREIPL